MPTLGLYTDFYFSLLIVSYVIKGYLIFWKKLKIGASKQVNKELMISLRMVKFIWDEILCNVTLTKNKKLAKE